MTSAEETWTNLEKLYGPYCGECGIPWRNQSFACPHNIRNVHPIPVYPPHNIQTVTPSARALQARDEWIAKQATRGLTQHQVNNALGFAALEGINAGLFDDTLALFQHAITRRLRVCSGNPVDLDPPTQKW